MMLPLVSRIGNARPKCHRIDTVEPPEPIFNLKLISRFEGVLPPAQTVRSIMRVNHGLPSPALQLFKRHPRIGKRVLVEMIQSAVRIGRPDELWHALG